MKFKKYNAEQFFANIYDAIPNNEAYIYKLSIDFKRHKQSFKGVVYVSLTEWFENAFNDQSNYTINNTAFEFSLIYDAQKADEAAFMMPKLLIRNKQTGSVGATFFTTMSTLKYLESKVAALLTELDESVDLWPKLEKPVVIDEPKPDVKDELKLLRAVGHVIHLPEITLKNYPEIQSLMLKAGGTYQAKSFIFEGDAESVLNRLLDGQIVNDKKLYQIYESTDNVSSKVVSKLDLQPKDKWLEPSAGRAAIANKMRKISPYGVVCEIFDLNIEALKNQGYTPIEGDFMSFSRDQIGMFDKIGANPPFCNNQDIKHVRKMYTHLIEGGRLVAVMSQCWVTSRQKMHVEFREWLKELGAEIETLERGEFKESGTNVATAIVTINKPLVNLEDQRKAA